MLYFPKKFSFWQESDFRRLTKSEATAITKESGKVNQQLEPCIFIEFENGKNVEFLIDTGFNGALCVPFSLVEELGLKTVSEVEIFGIGSHKESIEMAITNIIWFDRITAIEVLINNGDDRLLGSELLDGKILRINYQNKSLSISDK